MPTIEYIWDEVGDSYLMELDASGSTQVVYTQEPAPNDFLISERRVAGMYYYHFDPQRSTRQVTDEAQSIIDEFTYTAFGDELGNPQSTATAFRYLGNVGYYYDSDVTATYVMRRWYSASMGRWLSYDIQGFLDGPNLFAYARNNPLMYIDPTGLCVALVAGAATWIPGRGTFELASVDSGGSGGETGMLGSTTEIFWRPGAFVIARKCCCDSVSFIQVIRTKVSWGHGQMTEDKDWHIDQAVPYPGADVSDPCTHVGARINMQDRPAAPATNQRNYFPGTPTLNLTSLEQDMLTCVVCLEGSQTTPENFLLKLLHRMSGMFEELTLVIDGIAVYGCVHLRHSIRDTHRWPKYRFVREVVGHDIAMGYIMDNYVGKTQAVARNIPGAGPPAEWENKVIGYPVRGRSFGPAF